MAFVPVGAMAPPLAVLPLLVVASVLLDALALSLLCALMPAVKAHAESAITARLAAAEQHKTRAPQVSMAAHLA